MPFLNHLQQEKVDHGTLYNELTGLCKLIRNKPAAIADTGDGQHPRYQTTNNKIYNEEEVILNISGMNAIFAKCQQLMLGTECSDLLGKLSQFNSLVKEIHEDLKAWILC